MSLVEAEESFISPSANSTVTPPSAAAEPRMSLFAETRELKLTHKNGTGHKWFSKAFVNQQGEIKGRQSKCPPKPSNANNVVIVV